MNHDMFPVTPRKFLGDFECSLVSPKMLKLSHLFLSVLENDRMLKL
jgi:hypothetical protein